MLQFMGSQRVGHSLWTEQQQTDEDLLYSTGNLAQCSVIISMGKEFEKEWVLMGLTESLCCMPVTNTSLLINS